MSLITSLQENLGLSSPTPAQVPKQSLNDINKNSNAAGLTADNIQTANNPNQLQMNALYTPVASNWYAAKPYGFRMNRRDGKQFVMFLPISPSNINIVTNFATNIIPTLYGTVEEHSDIRYYDISIEGTTGMAPKFVNPTASGDEFNAYNSSAQPGRARFPINSNVALGGFFSSTVGQITNILNQANKAVSAISGLFGGTSGQAQPETGIYTNQTGYLAFHNLYRFLLKYKKDAAGVENGGTPRARHPLTFFNYKDGNEYDVAIRNFVLRRSAENPMMYYYSITMRAYNIRSAGQQLQVTEDLTQRLSDLGLNGVKSSSLLSSISSISNSAKAIVGSAVNGVNLFGK
jgi:hypothetical protein